VPAESPHVFGVLTWKKVGELLFEHASRRDVNVSRVLTTWSLVYEVLKDVRAEKKVASAIQKSLFDANVPLEESHEQGMSSTDHAQELGLSPQLPEDGTVTYKGVKAPSKDFTENFERTKSCSLKSLRTSLLGNQCIQL